MALPPVLQDFIDGPWLPKVVLGVLGVLIIGAAAHFLLLAPLKTEVAGLETQNATVQRELIQNRAVVAEFARFRAEMAQLQVRLAVLKDKLPTERETPPLYRTVQDAAVQSGLAVSLFQPRESRTRDYYNEIPIQITAEGGYHNLGSFLERVARLPRVVTLGELKASGLARSRSSMRADLTLATYVYRPVGSPPAPKPGEPQPAASAAPPAPATPPAATTPATGVSR
jgi:type IV pilus assembly protein PilO